MSAKLAGKVALITGGTSGIGAGTVRRFVAEGAKVVFTGSNETAASALSQETSAVFFKHRVEDAEAWPVLMADILTRFGRLDIAFANAGIEAGDSSVEEIAFDDWNHILAVNLSGVMLTAQHAVRAMRSNPGGPSGAIIINSSMSAYRPMGNFVAYSTTKGALVALSKSVAMHCANQKTQIRCNSIHPGVMPPMRDRQLSSHAARDKIIARVPLRRVGVPQDVSNAVLFLASDESAYITGTELSVDGGFLAT